jgi:hypothetical protein
MRSFLAAAALAATGSAMQVAVYESSDCTGPTISAFVAGNNRCSSVGGAFAVVPFQCGGGNVAFSVYGDTACGGTPAAGQLLSVSSTCKPVPANFADATSLWGNKRPGSMILLDTDCDPDTFVFNTCGKTDCSIVPNFGCSAFDLPSTSPCFDAGFYRFSTVRGDNGGVWTETVTMYQSTDVSCNGSVLFSLTNLPVDGETCRPFATGGAFAAPPGGSVTPQRPAAIPNPANPLGAIRCWSGQMAGNESMFEKELAPASSQVAYCLSLDIGLGADKAVYYSSGSSANVTTYLVFGSSPMYESMGYYQNIKLCSTPYCNVPPGYSNGAGAAALSALVPAVIASALLALARL